MRPLRSPPTSAWPGGRRRAGRRSGAAGAAGAGPLAGTTDLACEDIFARLNEVIMNRIATTVVILPRIVGVPMEPKTAWLPAPAERRADVGALAGLEQHDPDDGEAHQGM